MKRKVIIIDDEPLARSIVKEMLNHHEEFEVIDECANGFEGVKSIEKNNPELIFLDVQMPKINGFEMLELLEDKPQVIFTTAFDEYAIKAFDVSALDYLLKPFDNNRFDKAIEKYLKNIGTENKSPKDIPPPADQLNRIVIKDGSEIKIIPITEINYLEAYDDYVKIHTTEKTHLKHATMSFYENALNPGQFLRIHRSYIINLKKLTRIEPFEKSSYKAILTDGSSLSISRSSYPKVKKALGI
jgi:two-component system LytT family response regulator